MLKFTKPRLVAVAALLLLGNAVQASELMTLFDNACNSMGIDPKKCTCVANEVIRQHGEDAANYIALDMNLRYDEAAAALQRAGEDKAYAASATFEEAQHKQCSSGRLARQRGEYAAAGSGGVETAMDAAGASQTREQSAPMITAIFDAGFDVPVIDLSDHPAGGIIDVSGQFSRGVLAASGSRNLRDFIGFYAVVDRNGGIDTTGDGVANVHPGDENYSSTAQGRVLSSKLYWNKSGDDQQYLGEVRLPGGKQYAPLIMYRGDGSAAMPSFDPSTFDASTFDPEAMREQLTRGMKTNSNLFFAYDSANPDEATHIRMLDQQSFGFRDDIVVTIDGLTLE